MANKMLFIPYLRKGYSRYILEEDNLGKSGSDGKTSTVIKFRVEFDADKAVDNTMGSDLVAEKEFAVAGPSDVTRLDAAQIVTYSPKGSLVKVSMEYMPFIEFADEDFPWRYTPLKATSEGKLRPWLTIIVLKADEFQIKRTSNNQECVEISSTNGLKGIVPDPEKLYELAHVQVTFDDARMKLFDNSYNKDIGRFLEDYPERGVARLLCNRQMDPNTEYTVFVVPTFEQGRLAGLGMEYDNVPMQKAAWENPEGLSSLELPVYFRWNFTSGEASFLTLARRLSPISDPDYCNLQAHLNVDIEGCGLMNVKHSWVEGDKSGNSIIQVPTVLMPTTNNKVTKVESKEVREDLRGLLRKSPAFVQNASQLTGVTYTEDEDPWVVPPVYGGRHKLVLDDILNENYSQNVVNELNMQLRNRIPAGMGAEAVRNNQEDFVNRAWQQVEQVLKANQKIREACEAEKVNKVADERRSGRSRYLDQAYRVNDERFEGLLSDAALRVTNLSTAYSDEVSVDTLVSKVPDMEDDILGNVDAKNGKTIEEIKQIFNFESISELQKDLGKRHPLVVVASGKEDYFDVFEGYEFLRDILAVRVSGLENKETTIKRNGQGLLFVIEPKIHAYLTKEKAGIRINGKDNYLKMLGKAVTLSDISDLHTALLLNVSHYKDFFNTKAESNNDKKAKNRKPIFLKVNDEYPGIVLNDESYKEFSKHAAVQGDYVFVRVRIDKKDSYLVVTSLNHLLASNAKFKKGKTSVTYNKTTKRFTPSFRGNLKIDVMCLNEANIYETEKMTVWSDNPLINKPGYKSLRKLVQNKDVKDCIDMITIINNNFWLPTNAELSIPKNAFSCGKYSVGAWTLADGDKLLDGYSSWIMERQKEFMAEKDKIENMEELPGMKPIDYKKERVGNKEYSTKNVRNDIAKEYNISTKDLDDRISEKFPILAYPVLPDPTYFYLKEQSVRFLIPSVDSLKNNTISCFFTNPAFEEAYLAGMNTEMGKELLWREYPTDERGSYFRKFWDIQQDPEVINETYFDIKELHKWHDRLGMNHVKNTKKVVFVVNGDLLRNYPNTVIYLSSYDNKKGELSLAMEPSISGWLRENTYFVGFNVHNENEIIKLYLTFEELDRTLRFSHKSHENQTCNYANGGMYAKHHRVDVTVFGLPVSGIIKK